MSAVSNVTPLNPARDEYLEGLAQRVRMWRLREGKSYFSMPSSLWDEVVAAARKYPLREVSRVTGLKRDDIKLRMGLPVSVQAVSASAAAAAEEEAEFIESPGIARALAGAPVAERPVAAAPAAQAAHAPPAATANCGEAMVELTAADGTKLTVRMPVANFDVSSWIHNFRSHT